MSPLRVAGLGLLVIVGSLLGRAERRFWCRAFECWEANKEDDPPSGA